jgi:hypothetical protein
MFDDPDIWRAANLLVKRHKADAALVAARRADEVLTATDFEGCRIGTISRSLVARGSTEQR